MEWRKYFHSGIRQTVGIFLIVFALSGAWMFQQESQLIHSSQASLASISQVTAMPIAPALRSSLSPTPISETTTPLVKVKIRLTTATQTELETLPGIGPTKAKSILEYRDTKGFKTINDLEKVKGIGPKILEKLRPLVSL